MDPKLALPLALATLVGFAVQQAIQIVDPLIMGFIRWYKNWRTSKDLPGGMPDVDFKKAVVALVSFVMGLIAVELSKLRLLVLLGPEYGGPVDFVVTALVLSAGTQLANTLQKFGEYAKDAMKPKTVSVAIVPPSASVPRGTTFLFSASVTNSANQTVTWQVLHGAGGTVDANTGHYTAPATAGSYTVRATSAADPTASTTATVTVT